VSSVPSAVSFGVLNNPPFIRRSSKPHYLQQAGPAWRQSAPALQQAEPPSQHASPARQQAPSVAQHPLAAMAVGSADSLQQASTGSQHSRPSRQHAGDVSQHAPASQQARFWLQQFAGEAPPALAPSTARPNTKNVPANNLVNLFYSSECEFRMRNGTDANPKRKGGGGVTEGANLPR
jgi:hypothetical protein